MTPQLILLVFEFLLLMAGAGAWIVLLARGELRGWLAPALRFPRWDVPTSEFILFALLLIGATFGVIFLAVALAGVTVETLGETRSLLISGYAQNLGSIVALVIVRALPWGRPPVLGATTGAAIREGGIGFLVFFPLIALVGLGWNWLLESSGVDVTPQELVLLLGGMSDPLPISLLVLLVVAFAPLTEEAIFRGGLFRFLCHRMSLRAALAISAAVFAGIHFSAIALLPLFALGWALALVYLRAGHIAAPITLHACFNLTTVVLVLLHGPL